MYNMYVSMYAYMYIHTETIYIHPLCSYPEPSPQGRGKILNQGPKAGQDHEPRPKT